MKLPKLNAPEIEKELTDRFAGLDLTGAADCGSFAAAMNTSSAAYPSLSVRKKRYLINGTGGGIDGMCATDRLITVRDRKVYLGDAPVSGLTLTAGEKLMVPAGNRVYIFPDKVYINADGSAPGAVSMCEERSHAEGMVIIEPALKAFPSAEYVRSSSEPQISDPAGFEGKFWLDNGSVPCKLKKYGYDGSSGSFREVDPDCVRIIVMDSGFDLASGFFEPFSKGDGLTLSGGGAIGGVLDSLGLCGTFVMLAKGIGYAVIDRKIKGYRMALFQSGDSFTVKRSVPDLDFAVFAGNRLWGCSSAENRIYASRRDDLCSFFGSDSTTDDPISFDAGTPSEFTGAGVLAGSPVFFKEDFIHRIVGLSQSVIRAEGVRKGCSGSLCALGDSLLYMSRGRICRFSGGSPREISSMLGELSCASAVAGAVKDVYYIALAGEDGGTRTIVYDARYGVFHEEDPINASHCALCGGELCFALRSGDIISVNRESAGGQGEAHAESAVSWFAESGDIRMKDGGKKMLCRVSVRCALPEGSEGRIFVMYDNSGDYVFAGALENGCVSLPLRPVKSDIVRLRFEGTGDCRIISILRSYRKASVI